MSFITLINVIASIILKNNFSPVLDRYQIQINYAFHTIEKKIISIEIERWFYTIQKKNASYARKLIADSAIIFEKKNEIFIKNN